MSLMTILDQAAGGRLFAKLAQNLGLDAATTRDAMARLCPVIATALHDEAAKNDELFQSLLDLIEDGEEAASLEAPESLTSAEAMADGARILDDVFGSRDKAITALRKAEPALAERDLNTLSAVCATTVVAALAKANAPMALAAAVPQPVAGQQGGFLAALVSAIIAGIVSALSRQLAPRRRRTTSYTSARTKRRTTTRSRATPARRSRTTSASVESVFRDILGNLGR